MSDKSNEEDKRNAASESRITRRRAAMRKKGWKYASPGKPGLYVRSAPAPRKPANNKRIRRIVEQFCEDPALRIELLAAFSIQNDASKP